MGIDVWESSRRQRQTVLASCLYPGPGLGGIAIPLTFLSHLEGRECGQHTRFIELAGPKSTPPCRRTW